MARLAFLGLGQMGAPMATRLIEAGHDLVVWNRTPARAEPLASRGAVVAASPREAAEGAEAAITMLADPPALEAVLFGPDGASRGVAPGACLIEMSTVGPDPVRDVASRLPDGIDVLDAPVLGSVPAAVDGSLKILVGGDAAVYERWREVLEVIGIPQRIGPLGSGAAMKLVANASLGAAITALGEVLALADRLQIDEGVALDVLAGGALGNVVTRARGQIESREHPPRFKLSLAEKDLALVVDAARGSGLDARIAAAARTWFEEAAAAGRAEQDYPAVVDHIRGEPAAG